MKKNYFLLILLLILFILFTAYSYSSAISKELCDGVFRLHIIANSDSDDDQNLKYKVRDALLEYMNSLTSNCNSKSEVIEVANSHLSDFHNIAQKVITENGYNYDVNVEIGNFAFPTKVYGDISFPSGYYDALEVKIGSAKGHNWWCVMFPPLCFVDVTSGVVPTTSKDELQNNLSNEDYSIISDTDANAQIKFKIIELFKNIDIKLANN